MMQAPVLSWFEELFVLLKNSQQEELVDVTMPSWNRLQMIGLPDKKKESFGYFPLLKFYEAFSAAASSIPEGIRRAVVCPSLSSDMKAHVLPECRESCFIFVDGQYRPELSSLSALPKSVKAVSLEEAVKGSYSTFLKHRIQMWMQQEEDPFSLLNGSLCRGGLFLYIPPKVEVTVPVQFLSIQTKGSPDYSYAGPRVHIFGGAGSELHIVRTLFTEVATETKIKLYNGFLDIAAEERAIVTLIDSTGKNSEGLWGFETVRATIKKEGVFKCVLATFGAESWRHDYKISLVGEGADASLSGLAAVLPGRQSHVNIHIDHSAPNCQSQQLFKNALFAKSKASFTGKIYVKRAAQKTRAYQLNKNLLLDETAFVYSKPNLEIFADDVKASHGSTTAQIDSAQKQYLQTRGICAQEAASLLTQGFFQEVLDLVRLESIRKTLLVLYKKL